MSLALKKTLLYFDFKNDYVRLIEESDLRDSRTGPFFLSLEDRLSDGHYDRFDAAGLPVRMKYGGEVHNYTTLCSYALAHWQRYLRTAAEEHAHMLMNVANYIRQTGESTANGGIVLRGAGPEQRRGGSRGESVPPVQSESAN